VHVLPGAGGILFRLRHVGQGPADFGSWRCAAARAGAVAGPGVYATYSRRVTSWWSLGRQADRHPVRPQEAQLTGAPIALLEGDRCAERRLQHRLSLARNGTLAYTTGGTLGSRRAAWVTREAW